MRLTCFAWFVCLASPTLALALEANAAAQEATEAKSLKPAPAVTRVDVRPIVAKLKTAEAQRIQEALDEARLAGPAAAAAAPSIAEAVALGLSLPLTQFAVETLGELESDAGTAVLTQYAVHRNTKVRRAAVKALTRTKGPAAIVALEHALADSDALVRGTAASGLGAMKAKTTVGELFLALDHRVNEAAVSIGQLCNPEQCEKLASKLGKLSFDVVTGGLDQVLFRPAVEVSDDAKVKVLGRIREQGTIEGNKFLKEIQKRAVAPAFSARVRQAIDQAVLATAGGVK